MNSTVYVTHEGLKKLKDELNFLVNDRRPKITQSLSDARDKGDLSENAEYDAAREELFKIDRQIIDLQQKLTRVQILDDETMGTNEVRVLSTVKLLNTKTKKEVEYTLVDPLLADTSKGMISLQSPIAKGLLGKKVGETVSINIPAGEISLKVIKIHRGQGI